jgi:gas vesicle protein
MLHIERTIITGIVAFAGGLLAGILLAPDSGARTRKRIAKEAKSQLRNLGKQLDGLENRIEGLQKQVKESGSQFGERVVDAARQAGSHLGDKVADAAKQAVASAEKVEEAFHVEPNDVAKDLRRMPRK